VASWTRSNFSLDMSRSKRRKGTWAANRNCACRQRPDGHRTGQSAGFAVVAGLDNPPLCDYTRVITAKHPSGHFHESAATLPHKPTLHAAGAVRLGSPFMSTAGSELRRRCKFSELRMRRTVFDSRRQSDGSPRGTCSRDPLVIPKWEPALEIWHKFHRTAANVPSSVTILCA
jgi:hypothetical protein